MREDSMQGKVWFLDLNTAKETLLYDISLNKGDTFTVPITYGQSVRIVDSVWQESGRKAIRLSYGFPYVGHNGFLEGIGTFDASLLEEGINQILTPFCCFKNGVQSFHNTGLLLGFGTDSCYLDVSSKIEQLPKMIFARNISIIPNPANHKASISFLNPLHQITQIALLDLNGKVVANIQTTISSSCIFNTMSLPSGVYLIKAAHKNGFEIMPITIAH
jgi:hypothetical protein